MIYWYIENGKLHANLKRCDFRQYTTLGKILVGGDGDIPLPISLEASKDVADAQTIIDFLRTDWLLNRALLEHLDSSR